MTDPNDITQTSAVVDSAGGPGGIIGAVLGALTVLGGLWRVIFGTKAERIDANERAAELALRAAEHADERAERADESHRMALGTCEEQLRALREQQSRDRERIARLEAEHSTCGPRISAQAEQIAWMESAIDALHEGKPLPERTGSTPPPAQMPPRNQVRAGVLAQQQEETGP